MNPVDRIVRGLDRTQRRWPAAAFSYAVVKKFGDDQAGNLAALMAYYAFVSIFPLLLVFTTVLGYLLKDSPDLRERLVHSALVEFPVIGDQLRTTGLSGQWYILAGSVIVSLWGAQGVAGAAQNAFNGVWSVPYARRPAFAGRVLRSLGLLTAMGLAVLATGLLSGIGGGTGSVGVLLRVVAFAASAVLNVAIFLVGFRLATAREVTLREFALSAVVSAVVWQALLAVGTVLVAHQVRHQQALYGAFGVVLGLLAWLHLQAQLMLYAVEADVVRTRRLWPRSVTTPPLTQADRAAYRAYAESTRRLPTGEQDVEVRFTADAPDAPEAPRAPTAS